jgi:hypothetical protein
MNGSESLMEARDATCAWWPCDLRLAHDGECGNRYKPCRSEGSSSLFVARSKTRYARDHIVVDGYTLCGLVAANLLPSREVENTVVARMAHLCSRCWHAANSGGVRTNGGLFDG